MRTAGLPGGFRVSDPVLSANIYASGLLEDVLANAIAPYRRALPSSGSSAQSYLWLVRYSRGGEHLKLRVHGEAADRDELARVLAEHVDRCLAMVRDLPPAAPRIIRADVPAIDPEDDAPEPAPDRTLQWTTYRRSYVSLGGSPWIEDDRFVARACECLARASDLTLAAVTEGVCVSPAARQKVLIKHLISGLAAAGLEGTPGVAQYLKYHRDALLRFFIEDVAREDRLLAGFREQARRTALDSLRTIAVSAWGSGSDVEGRGLWPDAVAALATYASAFSGRADYQVNRFATSVVFPPLFKVLHGLANQLGVRWVEEASVHHLLLASVEPALAAREVAR